MTLVVACLVTVAALALVAQPPRRGVLGGWWGRTREGDVGGDRRVAATRAGGRRRVVAQGRARRDGVRRRGTRGMPGSLQDGPLDLVGVLHAVAAQLRAGVPPGAAWARVLAVPVEGQVPEPGVLLAALGSDARGRPRAGPEAVQHARVRAVVAGAHVAGETGAPLADVLEDLADAVASDAEQADDLAAALAGPRATARVLVLLPVLGLLVGAAMGARPWQVLGDGGLGTGLGVVGAALVVVGRAWVTALLRRAGAT